MYKYCVAYDFLIRNRIEMTNRFIHVAASVMCSSKDIIQLELNTETEAKKPKLWFPIPECQILVLYLNLIN